MKRLIRKILVLMVILFIGSTASKAYDYVVGEIYYNITSETDLTVEVTYGRRQSYNSGGNYSGSVVIPKTVALFGRTYSVTSIGKSAFKYCYNLTSITIPNSVTSIGENAFMECQDLTSITIPNSVTSIDDNAFSYFSDLTSIVVEEGNTVYDSRENCNAIIKTSSNTLMTGCKSTVIPNSVIGIGDNAFLGCRRIKSITIPNSVTSIGKNAFIGCKDLETVIIGNSVTSIGNVAFSGCENLKTVINLSDLYLSKGSIAHGYVAFYADKVIDADEQVGDFYFKTEGDFHYLVGYIGTDKEITLPENYKNENYVIGYEAFSGRYDLTSITIPNSVTSIEDGAFSGCYYLTSIVVELGNTVYESRDGNRAIVCKSNGNVVFSIARSITTKCISRTLTTLTLQISCKKDEYFESCGVTYDSKDYEADSKGIVTIPNLTPNKTFSFSIYSNYDQVRRDAMSTEYTTKDIIVNLTEIDGEIGATTLRIQGLYDIGDATFETCGFTTPSSIKGNIILLTGLEPNNSTTVSYYVTVKEGSYTYTKDVTSTFTTSELQFTTLPAKATSNTKAVICAETNIANEETGTGFEFRRIDAPDLVPSTIVYCAVHDGVMEGILNNLSANTYYKYRPFYKSASGKMYYGEWIGFGTADAYVYFTPTVHTYATAGVESNSVTLNGYALPGSDDILEQGFEYWTDGFVGTRAAGEVITVAATGQRMSITLNDLQYNTTYRYRAYVKTAKETTYGEEMTFTTGADPAGIGDVAAEDLDIKVRTVQGGIELCLTGEPATVRYALYTLNGTSIANGQLTSGEEWQRVGDSALPQGLYLLRVENNKLCRTVKVMVKQ